jgi:phospholipid/cholesterol/gamma-HCH transport system substrate-binding protein
LGLKISKEAKIGAVVSLAIALLVWGLNFLKGENIFSNKKDYYAIYSRIDGLTEGNAVQVNGYKVGRVSNVAFHPDQSGHVVVMFSLSGNAIHLPVDSRAKIFSSDLLGSKAVELIIGRDTTYLNSGDTLISEIEMNLQESVNRQIAPLKKKTEELISSIDSAVIIVQHILNEEARENLGQGFESIKRSFAKFESAANNLDELVGENKEKINDIFTKIQGIAGTLNRNNKALQNVIRNFSSISDSLVKADVASTFENANKAMLDASQIMDKINAGEGSIGLLVNNDSLYNNLDAVAADLDKLVKDINEHPKKYVHFSIFGRKDK